MSKRIYKLDKRLGKILGAKEDFPSLMEKESFIYLDSAGSTQVPNKVISAISRYYSKYHANVHHGAYSLSKKSTKIYEGVRKTIRNFINSRSAEEIIFTKGTTDGINLVANSYSEKYMKPGDESGITVLEHHANVCPWMFLTRKKKTKLKVLEADKDGNIEMGNYMKFLTKNLKILSFIHASNVLGNILPVREMIKYAHEKGVHVMLDCAQTVSHVEIDVQELGCDFLVCSSHKIYGPTGSGFLYGKKEILEKLPPYQTGGFILDDISYEKIKLKSSPRKFEAGTPNIAGVVGMGAAVNYIQGIGRNVIHEHEQELLKYAHKKFRTIHGLKILGNAKNKVGVISFIIKNIGVHDISSFLNKNNIAIRSGHHCAKPLMRHLKVQGTARISLGLYNDKSDIDVVVELLRKITKEKHD